MMTINNTDIDCAIKFKKTTENNYWYETKVLTGEIKKEHKGWRDNLSFTLAPRSIADRDSIENIILTSGGYLTITYPINSSQTATRSFWIDSYESDLQKSINGVHKFGVIECKVMEVDLHA